MIDENCGPNAFLIRVPDASMELRFRKDDFVVIDPDAPIRPGDYVLSGLAQGDRLEPFIGRYREGVNTDECEVMGRVVRYVSVL